MNYAKHLTEAPFTEKLKGLSSLFGIRFGEEPRYEILAGDQNREIRRYGELTLATVTEEGRFEEAGQAAFARLADYIFSEPGPCVPLTTLDHHHEERLDTMALTVPVLQQKSRRGWTLSFVLPQKFSLESAPRPQDPGITLERLAPRLVASARFSGAVSEEILEERTLELRKWLESNRAYRAVGEPLVALYDGPNTIPFLRRNEVQLPVQVKH